MKNKGYRSGNIQALEKESAARLLAASQQYRLVQRVRKEHKRRDDSRSSASCNRRRYLSRFPAETEEAMPNTKSLERSGRRDKDKNSTAAGRASGRRSTRQSPGTERG